MAEQAGSSSSAPAAAAEPAAHTNPEPETAPQQAASAAPSSPPRAFSQEEVNSFLAAERRKWAESEELKGLRAKAKRADELEAAQLSESERLTKRLSEAEAKAAALEARYRDAAIRARFATSALSAGIPAELPAVVGHRGRGTRSRDDARTRRSGTRRREDAKRGSQDEQDARDGALRCAPHPVNPVHPV